MYGVALQLHPDLNLALLPARSFFHCRDFEGFECRGFKSEYPCRARCGLDAGQWIRHISSRSGVRPTLIRIRVARNRVAFAGKNMLAAMKNQYEGYRAKSSSDERIAPLKTQHVRLCKLYVEIMKEHQVAKVRSRLRRQLCQRSSRLTWMLGSSSPSI